MKTEEVKVVILEADPGMELYNIADPSIYGKRIALGAGDSPENWAERPEPSVSELVSDSEQTVESPVVEISSDSE